MAQIQNTPLTAADLWADIQAVRSQAPLVHSITNFVVMNFNANVLLAAGASPVMAHAHDEVNDMVGIAQSLVLNIGTLDPYWVQSMKLALAAAKVRNIPVILDPVGAGATPYRNQTLDELLNVGHPTVIRGNGSEIMSTANAAIKTRGVDSSASANDALDAARALAERTQGTVCVSGETDHILDAQGRNRHIIQNNNVNWTIEGITLQKGSRIYSNAANGDYNGAIETAKISMEAAEKDGDQNYVKMNQKSIEEWSKKK